MPATRIHPTASCVCVVLASLLAMASNVVAAPPAQREDLTAAQRQLEALERIVEDSSTAASVAPGERYYFDYPRLLADLARVRAGIEQFLSPSRAQPREPDELPGRYRAESPSQPEERS
ncbi:RAQPRD family integrative conjugative element protein [Pseudomonas aeruginosa]|uniref:integrative conjugative element protein, RAQPRD family n=1 Tax=Pseudomonas aeruginosa TaxID=287 RepID=UPI0018C700C5|nr:RAQPRD family integrative conjugative element protein [Pseudomonas aeruginosa]